MPILFRSFSAGICLFLALWLLAPLESQHQAWAQSTPKKESGWFSGKKRKKKKRTKKREGIVFRRPRSTAPRVPSDLPPVTGQNYETGVTRTVGKADIPPQANVETNPRIPKRKRQYPKLKTGPRNAEPLNPALAGNSDQAVNHSGNLKKGKKKRIDPRNSDWAPHNEVADPSPLQPGGDLPALKGHSDEALNYAGRNKYRKKRNIEPRNPEPSTPALIGHSDEAVNYAGNGKYPKKRNIEPRNPEPTTPALIGHSDEAVNYTGNRKYQKKRNIGPRNPTPTTPALIGHSDEAVNYTGNSKYQRKRNISPRAPQEELPGLIGHSDELANFTGYRRKVRKGPNISPRNAQPYDPDPPFLLYGGDASPRVASPPVFQSRKEADPNMQSGTVGGEFDLGRRNRMVRKNSYKAMIAYDAGYKNFKAERKARWDKFWHPSRYQANTPEEKIKRARQKSRMNVDYLFASRYTKKDVEYIRLRKHWLTGFRPKDDRRILPKGQYDPVEAGLWEPNRAERQSMTFEKPQKLDDGSGLGESAPATEPTPPAESSPEIGTPSEPQKPEPK